MFFLLTNNNSLQNDVRVNETKTTYKIKKLETSYKSIGLEAIHAYV